ncbi:MAG: hypothetical protein AAGA45_05620, partial [Verrucomicrobiota bacterium]
LNDSVNTPRDIMKLCASDQYDLVFMKPLETFPLDELKANEDAIEFWMQEFEKVATKPRLSYPKSHDYDALNEVFKKYRDKLFKHNSKTLIKTVKTLSPISGFEPITVYMDDIELTVTIDIFADDLLPGDKENADLKMHSESLYFLFKNEFGFDTIMVNGCFEEVNPDGFSKSAKTFGLGNLNALGIYFTPSIITDTQTLKFFAGKLFEISKRLKGIRKAENA